MFTSDLVDGLLRSVISAACLPWATIAAAGIVIGRSLEKSGYVVTSSIVIEPVETPKKERKKKTHRVMSGQATHVFVKYPQLPKDIQIKIMSEFLTVKDLDYLSMSSEANDLLVRELVEMTERSKTAPRPFRIACIPQIHRAFETAVFLRRRGIDVPKENIRPFKDEYYQHIAENHAETTQAYHDYQAALATAVLEAEGLDDEIADADGWDETNRFPGIHINGKIGFCVVLPENAVCCCNSSDSDVGCHETCGCDGCIYSFTPCDHFCYSGDGSDGFELLFNEQTGEDLRGTYALCGHGKRGYSGNNLCVCHTLHYKTWNVTSDAADVDDSSSDTDSSGSVSD